MLGLSLENLYFFFARKYKIALTIIVGLFFSEHIFSYNSFFIFDSPLRIHVWDVANTVVLYGVYLWYSFICEYDVVDERIKEKVAHCAIRREGGLIDRLYP